MNHHVSRRAFVGLCAAAATSLATSAYAEEAPTEAAEPTESLDQLLPADPTYSDFVALAEEHPEALPPDPGPMGDGLGASTAASNGEGR